MNFCIHYYGSSGNFNTADRRYDTAIYPYLDLFDREQFIQLIIETNSNDQLYRRNKSIWANNNIVKSAKSILGTDFDFSEYPHFSFTNNDSGHDANTDTDEDNWDLI